MIITSILEIVNTANFDLGWCQFPNRENIFLARTSFLNRAVNVRAQEDKLYEAKLNDIMPVDFVERKLTELNTEQETLENSLASATDKTDLSQAIGVAVRELAYLSKAIYEANENVFVPIINEPPSKRTGNKEKLHGCG